MLKEKLIQLAKSVGIDIDKDVALTEKVYALGVLINLERTRELLPLMQALMQDEIDACAALCDDLDLAEAAMLIRARAQTVHVDADALAVRQLHLEAHNHVAPPSV